MLTCCRGLDAPVDRIVRAATPDRDTLRSNTTPNASTSTTEKSPLARLRSTVQRSADQTSRRTARKDAAKMDHEQIGGLLSAARSGTPRGGGKEARTPARGATGA
ncbi:hypothetical protein KIPE111705_30785 [Kibdelosporangium persicum]